MCSNCGSEDASRKCGGCRTASYCDPVCQKQHWRLHQQACRFLREHATESIPPPVPQAAMQQTTQHPPPRTTDSAPTSFPLSTMSWVLGDAGGPSSMRTSSSLLSSVEATRRGCLRDNVSAQNRPPWAIDVPQHSKEAQRSPPPRPTPPPPQSVWISCGALLPSQLVMFPNGVAGPLVEVYNISARLDTAHDVLWVAIQYNAGPIRPTTLESATHWYPFYYFTHTWPHRHNRGIEPMDQWGRECDAVGRFDEATVRRLWRTHANP